MQSRKVPVSPCNSPESPGNAFGSALLAGARECGPLADLVARVSRCETLRVSGVLPQAAAFLAAVLERETGGPLLLVTRGPREMEQLAGDIEEITGDQPFRFPAWETLPEDEREPHPDILGDRLLFLDALAAVRREGGDSTRRRRMIIVTTLRALSQKVVPPRQFSREVLSLSRGMSYPPERLRRALESGGYRRVEMVEEKGEYCVRGGIIDIFPPAADFPLRLDFFGERLDSLRSFHADTQLSISEIPSARIPPFSELGLMRRYRDALGPALDSLPDDAVIVVHEPAECVREIEREAPRGPFFLSTAELVKSLSARRRLSLSLLPQESAFDRGARPMTLEFSSLEPYRSVALGSETGERWKRRIFGFIAQWADEGMTILIACHNAGERRRLGELLRERGVRLSRGSGLHEARLSGGFIFAPGRLVVLTDKEIFARYRVSRPRRRFKGTGIGAEFIRLSPGDHVVHLNHGVGRYLGIKKLRKDGREREYLCVEYRDDARLYVPIEQSCLVERYVCPGRGAPQLDILGGKRWRTVRAAAQRAIVDYAADILSLQAVRQSRPGHPFGSDTEWQGEFEDAFIYEETPDQASAIEEVKRDMESPSPMDRLICGDVGYGKTEVAMRAAFKAVMDGRQVAVLVPTTVLAQQHFQTFSDRFADYPVRIEMLSRFRSEAGQRAVVTGLREGAVDIVIGTHRLVQPDVAFKDLGLVIIDEEQRFGVRHKERLKRFRMTVDVLTMTATPIPRTLYMSLSGIRDMSTITTPPEDRLAVETAVREYDAEAVRDAIRRELSREGQVYYVHNRVETIERVCERVRGLVPEAVVEVAHGQMGSDALEGVMKAFVEGKIGVLVCTTIIESGLDIPNVNTIIIDRADRFGLADLYQLRGRVGRYRHRAYAYLLYPPGTGLADEARRRLKAISEHASLGSGFSIALRDLEIRGAGNILGREQHGHMAAIGFDLYCKLLKRSIESQRGREKRGIEGLKIELPFPTALSAEYIPFDSQRLDIHKRLGEVTDEAEIESVAAEMRDRFGPLPESALCLLERCRLALRARDRGLSSVRLRGDRVVAVRGGEDVRPAGRYPRVTPGPPLDTIRKVREIVEKL